MHCSYFNIFTCSGVSKKSVSADETAGSLHHHQHNGDLSAWHSSNAAGNKLTVYDTTHRTYSMQAGLAANTQPSVVFPRDS